MTYYELLGVSPSSTNEEIRRAYENRIAELESGEQDSATKEESISRLREAYDTLSNETSREIYYHILTKEKSRLEAAGHPRASRKFGLHWLTTTAFGYVFLGVASLLLCFAVIDLKVGQAYWFCSDYPYIALVLKEGDPTDFWLSVSTLSFFGLIFARISLRMLFRVFHRLSDDF
jgi:hypothetical protein